MQFFKNFLGKLQAQIINIGLAIVLALLFFYIFCAKFRLLLISQNIDPNFIIGFLTVLALFLSLIQSSKDKRYSYNLQLINSIEDKGLKVIGKLITIKGKSFVMLSSAKKCMEAKRSQLIFKDLNNSHLKNDVELEMEIITAYVDSYFPEVGAKWNDLMDKLSEISNLTNPILLNYQENIELILKNQPFKNIALDNADTSLEKADEINQDIEVLTLIIRNDIATKINSSKQTLKNSFDFKL